MLISITSPYGLYKQCATHYRRQWVLFLESTIRHTLQSLHASSKQQGILICSLSGHQALPACTLNESGASRVREYYNPLRPDILITDPINRRHAHPNLSGLLRRLRADRQLVLESRCLSIINTPQSGLISPSDMLHSHFSTPSNVLRHRI